MTFDQHIIPPLHELAESLLQDKFYTKLVMVSQYLSVFENDQWQRLGDEERFFFLEKMDNDFHYRAWDFIDNTKNTPYSRVKTLIQQAKKQYAA